MKLTCKLSASLLFAGRGLVQAFLILVFLFGLAESRVVALQITEILTENDGGLRDADGDSPDWIELFNDTATPLNLAGWRLTDQPTNLVKWTFPATNLPSGTFLIVFASGKDRAVAGAELHTSFKLDSGGGYLALVEPDGTTVAQSFNYPAQRANVSLGFGRQTTTTSLVTAIWPARVLVPADDSLLTNWRETNFNDSAWLATLTPVGFNGSTSPPVVLALDFKERGVDVSSTTPPGFQSFVINSNISSVAIQTQATTRVYGSLSVTVSNTAPLGYDDRLRTTPLNSGTFTESLLLRDFIFSRETSGTGGLDVSLAGLVPSRGAAGCNRAGWIASIVGAMLLIFVGRQLGWGA